MEEEKSLSWYGVTSFKQGEKQYLVFTRNSYENFIFQYEPEEYMTTGTRVVELVGDNSLKRWNRFYITVLLKEEGQVRYNIYDNAALSGNPLLTEVNPAGYLDLSNLNYTGALYIEIAVLSPGVEIRDYKATYFSYNMPTVEFESIVKSNIILPNEIINTAYISTTTAESDTTNNSASYPLLAENTDLAITKTVDLVSARIGDELTYTITYENK
jgi:hypothetical protein